MRTLSLIVAVGLWILAAGCSYTFTYIDDMHIDKAESHLILEEAWKNFRNRDFDEALHLAEYLVEERPESEDAEDAFYLAGESAFQEGEYWDSFKHFRELLARFPGSQYVQEIVEREFQSGEAYLNREPGFFGHLFTNRSRGVQIMNHLVTQFSKSELADDAQMAVADYYYGDEEYLDAAFYYSQVIKDYSSLYSEWVEKALYRLGMSYIKGHKGFSYDRDDLLKALMVMESYIRNYPQGGQIEGARAARTLVREELAHKEFEIANFYFRQDCDYGARIHLANALIFFSDTEYGRKARTLLEDHEWDLTLHSADRMKPKDPMGFLP